MRRTTQLNHNTQLAPELQGSSWCVLCNAGLRSCMCKSAIAHLHSTHKVQQADPSSQNGLHSFVPGAVIALTGSAQQQTAVQAPCPTPWKG